MPSPDPLRVAVVGPESTGKTTLCEQLASHYGVAWVPEYAREYLDRLGRPCTADDILVIAREQHRREQEMAARGGKVLFSDTESLVTAIWFTDKFGLPPPWFDEVLSSHAHDLYLLTAPDLPWQADPLREDPHRLDYLFGLYRNALNTRRLSYRVIRGTGHERFASAMKAVDEALVARHGH